MAIRQQTTTQRDITSTVNHSTIAEVPIGKDTLVTDSLYRDLFLKKPIRARTIKRGDVEINLYTSVRSSPPPLPR